MMIESFVRVIAQQDAHDAGNDGKDTRLGRELLVGRLGNGCRVHHEKARDSYHEQLAADFLLDAFRGLRVKLPLRKVVALHRLVELFDLPSQMVGLPHHEACDPTPYGPNLSSKLPSFREWGWLQGLGWLVLLARTSWQAVHLASTQLLGIDRDLRRNRIRLQRREDQVEATSRWCARTAMASSATPRMLIADNSGSLLSTSASAEHAQTVVGRINRTHGPMRRSPNCRLGTA